MSPQPRPVGVLNEWGKLREVLVGDSSRCVFPRWSPDWGRYHGFKAMLHGLEGVSLQQAMPERAKGMIQQTEALVSELENHGVIVHRPRPLTDMEIAAPRSACVTNMPEIPKSSSASTSSKPICA